MPLNKDGLKLYHHYRAALHIGGMIEDLALISNILQLEPTTVHRRGDKTPDTRRIYKQDSWLYYAPVSVELPLNQHLQSLWSVLQSHKDFILSLKQLYSLQIWAYYDSNDTHHNLTVSTEDLEMFTQLGCPFSLSLNTISNTLPHPTINGHYVYQK